MTAVDVCVDDRDEDAVVDICSSVEFCWVEDSVVFSTVLGVLKGISDGVDSVESVKSCSRKTQSKSRHADRYAYSSKW